MVMMKPWTAEALEFAKRLAVERVCEGDTASEAAELVGASVRSVRRWCHAWRTLGEDGLRRRAGSGAPHKLTSEQEGQVLAWLQAAPSQFGFPSERWTAVRAGVLIEHFFGVRMNHRYLCDWFAQRDVSPQMPHRVPRERNPTAIRKWVRYRWPRIKKMAHDRGGTMTFTDESGFLLAPLARPSLAPKGQTPPLIQRARHRDKVSVAAALTISPAQGHLALHYHSYPNGYVNAQAYADFLRDLLRHIRNPLVVLQDQGGMHKGPIIQDLCRAFPRLELNMLPAYAPDLNPVEALWNYIKYHLLGNFVPLDIPQLDATVCRCLNGVCQDQDRLHSFFYATELPWIGVTGFI
jgi:transposase